MPGRLPHELYPASVRARLRRLRRLVVDDSAATLVPTFTISGTVLAAIDDSPLENVTFTLTGAAEDDTTTDASGEYEFTGMYSGSYSINFAIADHQDVDISFTLEGADVTDADASMSAFYAIVGTIYELDATTPKVGVTVYLFDSTGTEELDADISSDQEGIEGTYTLESQPNGTYIVKVDNTYVTAGDFEQEVEVLNEIHAPVDFSIGDSSVTLTGNIATDDPTAVEGVVMRLYANVDPFDVVVATATDANGDYFITIPTSSATFTLEPRLGGYTFDPPNVFVYNYAGTAPIEDVDFVATANA
jgi:hypothetical protein